MSTKFPGLVTRIRLQIERARARFDVVDIAISTFKRAVADDIGSYAAALTYFTFFSIFPVLSTGLAALGYLTLGNRELQQDIFRAGLTAAPMLRDALSPAGLELIESRRQELAVTGAVLALYTGSGAIVALERGLNNVWHVAAERGVLSRRLRSLRWLALLGLAAIASLALSGAARFGGNIFDSLVGGDVVAGALLHAAGILVSLGIYATAFKFLPARDLSWREVLPGAVAAAVVFEVLKTMGGAYIQTRTRGPNATFGAFTTTGGLLVAAYLSAQVTLLSAELNAVLVERRTTRQSLISQSEGGSA